MHKPVLKPGRDSAYYAKDVERLIENEKLCRMHMGDATYEAELANSTRLRDEAKAAEAANPPKTILCIECRATFSAAEIEELQATGCPSCGTQGIPGDLTKMHTLRLTDHEWRILFMWADNYERSFRKPDDGDQVRVIPAIIREARRQQPTLPTLSLLAEVEELCAKTGRKAELLGPNGQHEVVEPPVKH